MTDKKTLRRSLLTARRALPLDQWREKSDRLCSHLRSSPLFQQATTVLAYSSFRQEPDLSPLIQQEDKVWGFPRCVERLMVWHCWSPHTDGPLVAGAFGILEPRADLPELIADQVDLILVPSVACDRQGYRLGYGGGFYDRMLSQPTWAAIPTVGIVFADAHVDALPVDPWDQPLQGVCTDQGWFD